MHYLGNNLCHFICFFGLVAASTLNAQGGEPVSSASASATDANLAGENPPTPKAWAEAVLAKDNHDIAWVSSIVIATGRNDKGDFIFSSISADVFNALSFLKLTSSTDANFALRMNDPVANPQEDGAHVQNIFTVLGVDAVLIADPKSETWDLVISDRKGSSTSITAKGLSGKAAKNAKSVQRWIQKTIGYDGVILDVHDDSALVFIDAAYARIARQATVLDDSVDLRVVEKKGAKASAVIEKVAADGSYAIFKRVISRQNSSWAKGDKIVVAAEDEKELKEE